MISGSYGLADGRLDGQGYVNVSILEGTTVRPAPAVAGSPFTGQPMRSILPGPSGTLCFDDIYLSKHVLFIGGIGTGKTNAMMHMLRDLNNRPGDAVVSTRPEAQPGGVIWNLFADLLEEDPAERSDQIFEIASTIFSEDLAHAAQNMFFAAAARDVFAGVVDALARQPGPRDNAVLRAQLEAGHKELWELLRQDPDLAGAASRRKAHHGSSRTVFHEAVVRARGTRTHRQGRNARPASAIPAAERSSASRRPDLIWFA